jgi:AraC-like DNA-binding protein
MSLEYRALWHGGPDEASISQVALRYGFRHLGRFAADYRALYGESPSVTLRRGSNRGVTERALTRPHVKFR